MGPHFLLLSVEAAQVAVPVFLGGHWGCAAKGAIISARVVLFTFHMLGRESPRPFVVVGLSSTFHFFYRIQPPSRGMRVILPALR